MGSKFSVALAEKLPGKIAVAGVGNVMKTDDGAGNYIVNALKKYPGTRAFILDTGNIPENYLKTIRQYRPDSVLFIDAVDFGGRPGAYKIFPAEKIKDFSISTHNSSLGLVMEYIAADVSGPVLLLGIQPQNAGFGEGLTAKVKRSAGKLISMLAEIIA